MARSDLDLVLQLYDPDAEVWMNGVMAGVGIGSAVFAAMGASAPSHAEVDEAFEGVEVDDHARSSTAEIASPSEPTLSGVWSRAADSVAVTVKDGGTAG